ncbi:MAG TPA: outer membrane lipoprotein chaperone LolA [Gammaproteobacteria bacterium]
MTLPSARLFTMPFIRTFLMALALVIATPVSADDAKAEKALTALLSDMKTLQADFTQTVLNDELEPVRESRGSFKLERPGKFRWDYTAPFRQVIVGDGTNLWTYDPELEQATVKPMQETLASSPASLLTGTAPVGESFAIREIGLSGKLYWMELTPRVQDTDFQSVRVAIRDGELDTMELLDNLGQITRIRFENIRRDQPIPAAEFHFTPPENADVIGDALPVE